MGAVVENYSKHGDINDYIARHHDKKELFLNYRRRWNENVDDLLFLLLETVSKCNLSCPMCIHSVGYKQAPRMSDEVFNRALDGVCELNVPSIGMNATNEPLLDNKIISRINKVAQLPSVVDIHMNTNGMLLSGKVADQLIDSGLTRLLVGLDANKIETYANVRKGGELDKVKKSLYDFLELRDRKNSKFPVVRLSFVRMSINQDEINAWLDRWMDVVDYLVIQEFIVPVLDNSRDYLLPEGKARKNQYKAGIVPCRQPFERATIRGDGDVLPCCHHEATKMPIGNIMNQGLGEIWGGMKVREIREMFNDGSWKQNPICAQCLNAR